jgi:predicted SAM-dependent methyltransferase
MADSNYSLSNPSGLIDKLALKKRLTMLRLLLQEFPHESLEKILDVGVTADRHALSSNYFEKYYPDKAKIVALSNQNAGFLEEIYPGIQFSQGNALALPYANQSIDLVFSSAVIEHLGCQTNQKQMLSECVRVAKKGVFITTPNRWHPVELHTLLPLLHWLPKSTHRKILRMLGLGFYAQEENLNLLDRHTLQGFCLELGIRNYVIRSVRTLGFVSNLILIIKK